MRIILNNKEKTDIQNIISKAENIVILGHNAPDGDAVGSGLGLFHFLKEKNDNTKIIMPSETPEYLTFLPGFENIIFHIKNKKQTEEIFNKADLIFCVDFNSPERVEKMQDLLVNSKAVKVLLDHHPQPSDFPDYTFSDTSSSSASEIVFEFITAVYPNEKLPLNSATCIYSGMMTDTINFTVNSSQKRTFEIISELLGYKVDKDKIYDSVYNNFTADRMRFAGYVLYKKMKFIGNFSYMILTKDELKEFNYKHGDHEGFVNYPLSVKGIEASALFMEKEGYVKVSLRSKKDFDVNALGRKYFNGGGHTNAAGGKYYDSIEKIEQFFLNVLNKEKLKL